MPYLHVKDFKLGMDRRRPRASGIAGALWTGRNVHITKGGDIEGPKKFVPTYALPAGTFGMGQTKGQLFTFGSADLAATMPSGVQYQRLEANSANMTRVLHVKPFAGKLYVIAEFDDGTVYHFYDGTRITHWDTVSDLNLSYANLAEYLADKINNEAEVTAVSVGDSITLTARTAGVAFTLAKATVDNGANPDQDITLLSVQANVAGVDEVLATGTITITGGTSSPGINRIASVTVNGVAVTSVAIDWATSHTATATALAAEIIRGQATHGYSATAFGAVVTISAADGTGATPNGYVVSVITSGDVVASKTDMAGGVTAVTAVAQIDTATFTGTVQAQDKFTLTVNGTDYVATPRGAAAGTSVYVHKKRAWSPAAMLMRYCKISDPTDWTDANVASGAGFLAVSSESEGYERAVGAAPYNQQTAIFSRGTIYLYTLYTDAEDNTFDTAIENSGTVAHESITGFGNSEVFYLDLSGVRSLRARSGTNAPYVADVGSAIDGFIQDHMKTLPKDTISQAVGAIEPQDGRFWLALGERIYVLSFFPSSKITAWSYYEPGFEVTDFVRARDRLYARAADTIYLYGGADNETYPEDDEITRRVELPFLTAETPATLKKNAGFDVSLTNTWEITVATDQNRQDVVDAIGNVSKVTNGQPHMTIPGLQPAWALNFECSKGGPATISNFSIHYDNGEAK